MTGSCRIDRFEGSSNLRGSLLRLVDDLVNEVGFKRPQ
jgi:hypothetical protein